VKAWAGLQTQKGGQDEPPFPFRCAVKPGSRPYVFILEIFPDDLFDGQALNVLALAKVEAEVALEVGIVGEALEIGLSARLAGLIRRRDCHRRNSDVIATIPCDLFG
jgi:hypothetical protein